MEIKKEIIEIVRCMCKSSWSTWSSGSAVESHTHILMENAHSLRSPKRTGIQSQSKVVFPHKFP